MSDALRPSLPARNARYAVSAIFLVFGTLVGSWLPHIPDVKRHLGVNDWSLGEALLCSGLGAVISMQLMGFLMHRFGSRNLCLFGALGACLFVPLLMLHATVGTFALNLFILGLLYGCLDSAMNSHAVQVQARHERPIMSAIHGWFSFGGIVGGITTSLAVKEGLSPLNHLIVTSTVLIALTVGSFFFLLPADIDKDTEGPRFVLPHGFLLFLGIMCACAFVAEGGIMDWNALYVRESLHAPAELGGIATAFAAGSMAFGRFVGDPLLHRFGDRKVVLISGIVTTVGILLAVATPSVWFSIACLSVTCFGIANTVPVFFKEAGNLPGISTSAAIAALTTCGYGGFLIGPPVIGMIAHKLSLGVALGGMSLLRLTLVLGASRLKNNPAAP